MNKQLQGIRDKLDDMLARAQDFADSENETTAAKYEHVPDSIQAAIDAIDEAMDELNKE